MSRRIKFTVDALLLRELGERLVGRPAVALAELIKNAYDADASVVEVGLLNGEIWVADNGHGMTEDEFVSRWMRVGTNKKEIEGVSREKNRRLTGSKGVGRLAAQLLGSSIRVESHTGGPSDPGFKASVNWAVAQQAGDLVSAEAEVSSGVALAGLHLPEPSYRGTRITIADLITETWEATDIRTVAQEVWDLIPPLRGDANTDFEVRLAGDFAEHSKTFLANVETALNNWTSRIQGVLVVDTGQLCAHVFERVRPPSGGEEFGWRLLPARPQDRATRREHSKVLRLTIHTDVDHEARAFNVRILESSLANFSFDIRRYVARGRQAGGVKVESLRKYLEQYRGIHVFDSGFRLSYYDQSRDWLRLTHDVARRYGALDLLADIAPEFVDVDMSRAGLNLPTVRELYGEVHVSTNPELQPKPAPRLTLQVTRDRLLENASYEELRMMVRLSLELYAAERSRARLQELERVVDDEKAPRVESSLERIVKAASTLPAPEQREITSAASDLKSRLKAERDLERAHVNLIASMASAGLLALATFHDFEKNVARIDDLERALTSADRVSAQHALGSLAALRQSVEQWRHFYAPFREAENRTETPRIPVDVVFEGVMPIFENPELTRGTRISFKGDHGLRFPPGLYPAWLSALQNLLLNALAATLETSERRVEVVARHDENRGYIEVKDTGIGMNLGLADSYFQPFTQGPAATSTAIELGLSGSGLGLFIVRLVCRTYGAQVRFVRPDKGFATCVQISWEREP